MANQLSSREVHASKLAELLADVQSGQVFISKYIREDDYEGLDDSAGNVVDAELPVNFVIQIKGRRLK